MATKIITLKVSGSVPAEDTLRAEYVPATGETCYLIEFDGHAAFSPNAAVCVCMDDAGTPEVRWSTKGDDDIKGIFEQVTTASNGVKKLELILDNSNTTGALVMTGKAEIMVTS